MDVSLAEFEYRMEMFVGQLNHKHGDIDRIIEYKYFCLVLKFVFGTPTNTLGI